MKFMTKVMAKHALNTCLSVIALSTQVNVIYAAMVNDAEARPMSELESFAHEKSKSQYYPRERANKHESELRVHSVHPLGFASPERTTSPSGNRLALMLSPLPRVLVVGDDYDAKKQARTKIHGHSRRRVKKQKIDLNIADEATLEKVLTGISNRDACAIIDYRTKHGKFKTVAELVNVGVIEPQVINHHLRAWLTRVDVSK